jgi:hypothetical protein
VIVGLGLTGLFFVLSALLAPVGAVLDLLAGRRRRRSLSRVVYQASVAAGMVMATAAVVVVGDLPWLEPLIATGAVLASLLVGAWIMAAVVSIRRVKHRGRHRSFSRRPVAPSFRTARPAALASSENSRADAPIRVSPQTSTL